MTASKLAGEPITAKLTRAPGNNAPIGGLKVVTGERLVRGAAIGHRKHLQDLRRELQGRAASAAIVAEAQQIVDNALGGAYDLAGSRSSFSSMSTTH